MATIRKLHKMPYAQAEVWDYNNGVSVLVSYVTEVIIVDNGWMECTGLYSMTTRKHISAFLREYYPAISFEMVKYIAGTKRKVNILTGEIIEPIS